MKKEELKKLIDTAAGRTLADVLIKNCKIVDVYNCEIIESDLAISGKYIAGFAKSYKALKEIDAQGNYVMPGFIDSHIHIESSYVSPEEFAAMVIPHGTTTVIADPHEIVNVCGLDGFYYMQNAGKHTPLDARFAMPSCVPATEFEHAGAVIGADEMRNDFESKNVEVLGEFMNFPGIINADSAILDKLLVAINNNSVIDGHSPALSGNGLNAYVAGNVATDHECSSVEEMKDRLSRGMYVQMRQGSACRDLRALLKGVTAANSSRCLLCSDDRQPKTIFTEGHVDGHLRMCIEEGIDPFTAIRMATLNAATCYRLYDKGGIAPGKVANIVIADSLENFNVKKVFIDGQLVAENGEYLLSVEKADNTSVKESFNVKDFSIDKLKMKLKSNKVHVIELVPDGVLTKKVVKTVDIDANGDFIYNENQDILKMAVIERHKGTGNVGLGFLGNYGLKKGAVALSIAHDSHNIIVVGVSNEEMYAAVNALIKQGGGIVLVNNQEVIESMPMPIAGIMSDKSGKYVSEKLESIHNAAHNELKISSSAEPVMTLCFMSLLVIPELKLTDSGLFDVISFSFIDIEAQ